MNEKHQTKQSRLKIRLNFRELLRNGCRGRELSGTWCTSFKAALGTVRTHRAVLNELQVGRAPDTSETIQGKMMVWRNHLARTLPTIYGLRSSVCEQETYPALSTSRGFTPGSKQHKRQAEEQGGYDTCNTCACHIVFGTQTTAVVKCNSDLLESV